MNKKTELKMRTIARQESQLRISEFVSTVGHDIKTPLTSIKGNIQLLRRRLSTNRLSERPTEINQALTEARELLERTDIQINRLTQFVNNLLESSKISNNTMDLLFEVGELTELVNEVLTNPHYCQPERTIHTHLPAEQNIFILADVNRIKQVIIHYLSNAHKYSELHQPIDITLSEDGKMACIAVQDYGPGIAAREQQKIWERYYRIPNTFTFNGSEVGLGLGLHISAQIIKQHRGQVGLTSKLGQGSTFWFKIPLAETSLNHLT
ncbi:sensor histidine kinase [Tengunoibacter tsumagoiensis]|nr:HAMP domain-containing sensor histidine kinase [Tengunoibacter tsumagoiensis]